MYEVELKVRADHERVRERLDDLDVELAEHVRQVDTYYDAPHRDFAETDEAFRIREERRAGETTAKMTYKGPLVEKESKTREEFETTVGDPEIAGDIFESLGFSPAATVEKDRDVYRQGDFVVTLDTVDGLGEFVEVETEVETNIEAARRDAADLLRELGLDPETQIRTSYLGLRLE